MTLGKYPHLKREWRRIRAKRDKVFIFRSHAHASLHLLPDNVAKNAALFVGEVTPRSFQLFHYLLGQNRQGNNLRVRMLQRSAGSFTVIFKDQNVFEAAVLLQVEDAIAKRPEHIFHTLD